MAVNFARGQFMRPKGQQRVSAMHEQLVFAGRGKMVEPQSLPKSIRNVSKEHFWEVFGGNLRGRRRRVAYHLVGDCKAFWPHSRPKGSAENCPTRPLAASSLRWRIGLVPEPDGNVPRNCGLGGSCHRGLGQDLHQCFGG